MPQTRRRLKDFILAIPREHFEVMVFMLIWAVFVISTSLFSYFAKFYSTPGNMQGVLVEMHGMAIELLIVGVVAGLWLSRKNKADYSSITRLIRNRLLGCCSDAIRSMPINKYAESKYLRFGNDSLAIPASCLEPTTIENSSEVFYWIMDWAKEDALNAPYAKEGKVVTDREILVADMRSDLISVTRSLSPTLDLLASLPGSASSPDLLTLAVSLQTCIDKAVVQLSLHRATDPRPCVTTGVTCQAVFNQSKDLIQDIAENADRVLKEEEHFQSVERKIAVLNESLQYNLKSRKPPE